MIRVVLDTNTIVSGLLWGGVPRKLLDAASASEVEIYTSNELVEVMSRDKFAAKVAEQGGDPHNLIEKGFLRLASIVETAQVVGVVKDDPDDDALFSCGIAARVDVIVSGDSHLLRLRRLGDIEIVTPGDFLTRHLGKK